MRSEGFPFIVWGSGGWTLVRLEWLVASSSSGRRRVDVGLSSGRRGVVNSVSMWKLQTLCFSKASKQVVMSFCAAGIPLCDSPNLFDNVSKVSKLEDVSQEMPVLLRPRVLSWVCSTLWQSNLLDNVSKVSKLEDVSHEMLVLLRPRVLSWVSSFLDTSPCLWGKLQNLSFSKVSKQVVMSVCSTNDCWEVLCASFVVQSGTGKCCVQAL